MIILQCGHKVIDLEEVYDAKIASYARDGMRCVKYAAICKSCKKEYELVGELLHDEEEIKEWLREHK